MRWFNIIYESVASLNDLGSIDKLIFCQQSLLKTLKILRLFPKHPKYDLKKI